MRKRGWVPVERLPWEPTRYQSPIPQLFGKEASDVDGPSKTTHDLQKNVRRSKVKDSDMSMSIQKIT